MRLLQQVRVPNLSFGSKSARQHPEQTRVTVSPSATDSEFTGEQLLGGTAEEAEGNSIDARYGQDEITSGLVGPNSLFYTNE